MKRRPGQWDRVVPLIPPPADAGSTQPDEARVAVDELLEAARDLLREARGGRIGRGQSNPIPAERWSDPPP